MLEERLLQHQWQCERQNRELNSQVEACLQALRGFALARGAHSGIVVAQSDLQASAVAVELQGSVEGTRVRAR